MKSLICKLFGCNWRYLFTGSDSFSERVDVRVCKCCGNVQQYKKLPTNPYGEWFWVSMVGYTKLGAKKHWGNKI